MNEKLGLRVLSALMRWEDETAREEFAWLRLMARLKYDRYRDFQAGVGFIDSLASWLQQFPKSDRSAAYRFVKERLVFISPAEMHRLVEQLYPSIIHRQIVDFVAQEFEIPSYRILADREAADFLKQLRRKTLIVGLSDGARLDIVRHTNVGRISNEQIIPTTQINPDKWKDLINTLRKDLDDQSAVFRLVFLVDDFTASGSSFLRWDEDDELWTGKLCRFYDSVKSASSTCNMGPVLDPDSLVSIHHYISTHQADKAIQENVKKAEAELDSLPWAKGSKTTATVLLSPDLCVTACKDAEFYDLSQRFYNDRIETEHTLKGGVKSMALGYAGCALPIILEHNTPNNSVALLWAETQADDKCGLPAHAMRPLFRRRQRHV